MRPGLRREVDASTGAGSACDTLCNASTVIAIVASAFAIGADEIQAERRGGKETAFARQVAIYLVHTRLGLGYAAAGALFGRDRTTAAYACRVVEDRREDPRIDGLVDCLERAVDRLRLARGGEESK